MRTILIGMNNPLSTARSHALYPWPPRCTGWNLWQMLHARTGVIAQSYADAFERMNLVEDTTWDRRRARLTADALMEEERLVGRRVVVLGAAVRDAFRLPPVLVEPVVSRGVTWRQLPHPSGRNRWYNDPKCRAMAELLLEEEYRRSVA